jgi:hypothetical protein
MPSKTIHGHSARSQMVEQPMCGGKAIHKFLSKKGTKELYRQHEQQLRQHGFPSLASSDTSSTVEAPNHQRIRENDHRRPLRPSHVSEKQAYTYDQLPATPTHHMNPRSFENVPPEMEASQYKPYNYPHQSDHVLQSQSPKLIKQPNTNESSNYHRSKHTRSTPTAPTKQQDSTNGSGHHRNLQNSLPTLSEVPSDAGRVMEALQRIADLDDNVDDSVKLEALRAMRDVVIQQQETLKTMSTQNHTYRRKLGVAQTKFHSFHQCQMNQMTMIEKLQMEKDSFESEALLLQEENRILRQELEHLRKYAPRDNDTRQPRQPRQPRQHANQQMPGNQVDTAHWHLQRERESSRQAADESPWQSFYPHASENSYSPPLPNPEAYAKQRNLQPSNAAPDPPEEMNSGPSPEDNTRREEYLRDMEYVRRLLSKHESDEAEESLGSDIGEKSNNYNPNFQFEGQMDSSKGAASRHQNHEKNNPITGRMTNNQASGHSAESHYIDTTGNYRRKFQFDGQIDSNEEASRRQNHDKNHQNPGRMMGNRVSSHPAESFYIDTAARGEYENPNRVQPSKRQPSSTPNDAQDNSPQAASMMHFPDRSDNNARAMQFAKALNQRRSIDGNRKDQETMSWRSSSPATIRGSGMQQPRNHPDTREQDFSSDWEEEDSDSLATIERKRENPENPLGAAPFSVENMTELDGISEQDRHILRAAAYHSRVQKVMHQNKQSRDNSSY